jgi:hypothetical protein
MEDVNVIALLLMFLIGLVMLFAQLRLFSIDKTLKEIRDDLRSRNGETVPDVPERSSVTKLGL